MNRPISPEALSTCRRWTAALSALVRTLEGIEIAASYDAAFIESFDLTDGLPSFAPFVRASFRSWLDFHDSRRASCERTPSYFNPVPFWA